CGTASECLLLAKQSRTHVVGVDLTEPMLRQGRGNVANAGLADRIHLLVGSAERLPLADASFDAVTSTYLLRYVADPQAVLRELARVLRPGGVFASLDFFVPPNPIWRTCWSVYTRALLPMAGLLLGGRAWFRVGRFLGPNITRHYERHPLAWTVTAWENAGFTGVEARVMSLGGGLVMWGRRGK
ncbi:MAG TPA: class I SAM-dependent methyltransferase, partial [Acidimicrobiales bacterium]|nr:class I SAM-dependent methyltransferase [Acidimicrobiales bacterium]